MYQWLKHKTKTKSYGGALDPDVYIKYCLKPYKVPSVPSGYVGQEGSFGALTSYWIGYGLLGLMEKLGVAALPYVQGVLDIFAMQGVLKKVTMTNFGAGYTAGNVLTLQVGNPPYPTITVNTVQAVTGKILTYTPSLGAGQGIPIITTVGATGGSGTNAAFEVQSDILQRANGAWYSSYFPVATPEGFTFIPASFLVPGTNIPAGSPLTADSDVGLIVHAMAKFDELNGGTTRYLVPVQRALSYIRRLQVNMENAHGSELLSGIEFPIGYYTTNGFIDVEGPFDPVGFSADTAECLLSIKQTLDTYGAGLLTSDGYSVATLGNNMYEGFTNTSLPGWVDGPDPLDLTNYYQTVYPNTSPVIPFPLTQKICYVQSICAMSNYLWVGSGYLSGPPDRTYQCELALDCALPMVTGRWGGTQYSPLLPGVPNNEHNYYAYTALMIYAMQTINATKYSRQITGGLEFMRWLLHLDGLPLDSADRAGKLYVPTRFTPPAEPLGEEYAHRMEINFGQGWLAGA